MPDSNKDRTFILVEVADNAPAVALVENLIDTMGGTVVDMVSAEIAVIEKLGKPAIKWLDDF